MTKGDKIKNIGYQDPTFGYAILTITEITETGWIKAVTDDGCERMYLPDNEGRTWEKVRTESIVSDSEFKLEIDNWRKIFSDQEIATLCEVATPTVARWAAGTACPLPRMRGIVLKWLSDAHAKTKVKVEDFARDEG